MGEKKKSQSLWQYSSQHCIPVMWMERTQNLHFQNCISAPGSWRKPVWFRCGMGGAVCIGLASCVFGAGAHLAVGYRCLLSSINVASMWNHGTHNTTQRLTPLIVWEISPSWRIPSRRAGIHSWTEGPFSEGWNQERDPNDTELGTRICLMLYL